MQSYMKAGITKLRHLLDPGTCRWRSALDIGSQVGCRSMWQVSELIRRLKVSLPDTLTPSTISFMENANRMVLFPDLLFSPRAAVDEVREGQLLSFRWMKDLRFATVGKKTLYYLCCKSAHSKQLARRPDTKWREKMLVPPALSPTWRLLYKAPIPKRTRDLQRRVFHSAVPTNVFVSRFNSDVLPNCPFCFALDTVYQIFTQCLRVAPLFALLEKMLRNLGFLFNHCLFVFTVRYSKENTGRWTMANFETVGGRWGE